MSRHFPKVAETLEKQMIFKDQEWLSSQYANRLQCNRHALSPVVGKMVHALRQRGEDGRGTRLEKHTLQFRRNGRD